MENKQKQIADHHDNVTRLKAEHDFISDEWKYIRGKIERDFIYMKTSSDRVADMKINNYDKIIDMEIFLLKLFIPIFGISFAAGVNIFGIDTYTLKYLSFLIIILVGLFIAITFISRKRIVDSEQGFHKQELDLMKKEKSDMVENLLTRINQIQKDLKLAIENEPNLL